MFLKALNIKGFKSFAESADLQLEPGITVVVGPNGSGKSNVVDAMAWVLGAQAPSAVRSQKMEDVIFAGTAAKKALGRAEVSITIDNTDGTLDIEFTEVTITRTLFRSGESDYAINGVACRLLDVQELLSDSGVGKQQHIIISQGRIDDVLNARPEERRAIVEEAAGVLKYRKRRERAERRLDATGENLSRLQDLVREVKRQIRPLERQAEAAQKHKALAAELNSLKTHLAGRELKALKGNLETSARERHENTERVCQTKSQLANLDATIMAHETELTSLGGSDVAELLSRAKSLTERVRGQRNVVSERNARLKSELEAAIDDGLVANLEAEASRVVAQLAVASSEIDALQPEFAELASSETELKSEQLSFDNVWGDSLAPSPNRAGEVKANIEALAVASDRYEKEMARFASQISAAEERDGRLKVAAEQATRVISEAGPARAELEKALSEAQTRRDQCKAELEQSVQRRNNADKELAEWGARKDALTQALDQSETDSASVALENSAGVIGRLLDLIEIEPGWDLAVEVVLGDALDGVVIDGEMNAKQALKLLDQQELLGVVLPLGVDQSSLTQESSLGRFDTLDQHVRPLYESVAPLLQRLLGSVRIAPGDWTTGVEAVLSGVAHNEPDTKFVTQNGDLFANHRWSLNLGKGKEKVLATAKALTQAENKQVEASAQYGQLADQVKSGRQTLETFQAELDSKQAQLRNFETKFSTANTDSRRLAEELNELETTREQLAEQRKSVYEQKQQDAEKLRELMSELPALETHEQELRNQADALADSRTTLEKKSQAVASRRTELEVRIAAIEERRELLKRRQVETETRLERLVTERDRARVRREGLELAIERVSEIDSALVSNQEILFGYVEALTNEQRKQSEAAQEVSNKLSACRAERSEAETTLGKVDELLRRLDISDAEFRVKLEALTEALRRELNVDPEIAMTTECPELKGDQTPEARTRDVERELQILGAINPLALEEFEELKQRHEFLTEQLDDVKSARRDLHKLIRSIDEEIVTVFAAAYADVSTNFVGLFETLFPGGKGGLKLANGEDLLNCGIEIEAKPSGKNVKKLSLLSGGERSLVALAFLFAVFKSRPSPFYVMDEVEAALDDSNLSRFLALVEEFRKEAQLIIVSHQKRTMEAADVLYGVTMKPGGSSKVVSEKVATRTEGRTPTVDLRETSQQTNTESNAEIETDAVAELQDMDGSEAADEPDDTSELEANAELDGVDEFVAGADAKDIDEVQDTTIVEGVAESEVASRI